MKKKINFISIFIAFIALFTVSFFISKTNSDLVKADCDNSSAADLGKCTETAGEGGSVYGSLEITNEGKVTVTYDEGLSYFIVYAAECSEYGVDDKGNKVCNGAYNRNKKIIFASSDYYRRSSINGEIKDYNYKTVHMYNYYDANSLVKVQVYYGFINFSTENYKKEFDDRRNISGKSEDKDKEIIVSCNLGGIVEACSNFAGTLGSEYLFRPSIVHFVAGMLDENKRAPYAYNTESENELSNISSAKSILEYMDKKSVVYKASGGTGKTDGGVVVKVANSTDDDAAANVEELIYETIVPAIMVVLGIAAVVTIIVLGYQIVKEADDVQQRKDNIARIRNILIGIAIAFLILFAIEPIVKFIKGFLE